MSIILKMNASTNPCPNVSKIGYGDFVVILRYQHLKRKKPESIKQIAGCFSH